MKGDTADPRPAPGGYRTAWHPQKGQLWVGEAFIVMAFCSRTPWLSPSLLKPWPEVHSWDPQFIGRLPQEDGLLLWLNTN